MQIRRKSDQVVFYQGDDIAVEEFCNFFTPTNVEYGEAGEVAKIEEFEKLNPDDLEKFYDCCEWTNLNKQLLEESKDVVLEYFENGEPLPEEWKKYRQEIRLNCQYNGEGLVDPTLPVKPE